MVKGEPGAACVDMKVALESVCFVAKASTKKVLQEEHTEHVFAKKCIANNARVVKCLGV